MHVLITAGGTPEPNHPLYAYTQGQPKALLDIAGRPMIEYVIAALQDAKSVDEIVVIGLGENIGKQLKTKRSIHHLPNQESLLKNTVVGINWIKKIDPNCEKLLLCTSDIPLLTGDIVDSFVNLCTGDFGMYYALIPQATMEAAFPSSKRTYTKLQDIIFTGGDLCLSTPELVSSNLELWELLIAKRKSPIKIARQFGWKTVLKLLTRQLTVADCNAIATRVLRIPCKGVECPFPELGMDGDKPFQVDMLREEMSHLGN